jgi:outer membrane protein TolC
MKRVTLPFPSQVGPSATTLAARLAGVALVGLTTVAAQAQAQAQTPAPARPLDASRCLDAATLDAVVEDTAGGYDNSTPRERLSWMVKTAVSRSQALGATALLAEAARDDLAVERAAKDMVATVTTGGGPGASRNDGATQSALGQFKAELKVSKLLWDGGRVDSLIDWRSLVADAARYGRLNAEEQVAATTVSLTLERSRYRQHVIVYGQQIRKMQCLVDALQQVVEADRGRASELVQARKNLQQAELSRIQAVSQVRQIEVRLRKLVGDGLPSTEGLTSVLLMTPPVNQVASQLTSAPEIAALDAQAAAAQRFMESVEKSTKPTVSWTVGSKTGFGFGGNPSTNRDFSAGIDISIPLTSNGNEHATEAARKRAQAAQLQRDEALESRRARLNEIFEQTNAAMERARRVGAVLRDSEQLRDFTLQQWQQLGRRSLFDVMSTESEHYNLRVQYVNALYDQQQMNAALLSLGRGVGVWLR